ncbi:hypothetical protein Tco_0685733 [Tanacetum coccineum]
MRRRAAANCSSSCDVPTCDNNHVNVESDLVESLINHDILIVPSSKIDPILEEFASELAHIAPIPPGIIDPILEEFAGELAHIAPIPPGIVEADFDSNDDTSSDDDDFEDIEYVSLEEVNEVDQEEKEFDLEDILQIQDVILREKLLNVSRLISNIESLKDNPIPVMDSDSSITSLSFSDNSLPEFESFSDHTEETRSGSTTTHANYSLPEFESFHFDNSSFSRPPPELPDVEISLDFEPDAPERDRTIPSHLPFVLFSHFSPTPRFLFYLAPPGVKIRSLTTGSPLERFGGGASHRGWNFMCFNVYPYINESRLRFSLPFASPSDQIIRGRIALDFEDSRAHGFVQFLTFELLS